jgi:hypothetical protein
MMTHEWFTERGGLRGAREEYEAEAVRAAAVGRKVAAQRRRNADGRRWWCGVLGHVWSGADSDEAGEASDQLSRRGDCRLRTRERRRRGHGRRHGRNGAVGRRLYGAGAGMWQHCHGAWRHVETAC